jgi:hypothetical protein
LKYIDLNNPHLQAIKTNAFNSGIVATEPGTFILPSNIIRIGNRAFYKCDFVPGCSLQIGSPELLSVLDLSLETGYKNRGKFWPNNNVYFNSITFYSSLYDSNSLGWD